MPRRRMQSYLEEKTHRGYPIVPPWTSEPNILILSLVWTILLLVIGFGLVMIGQDQTLKVLGVSLVALSMISLTVSVYFLKRRNKPPSGNSVLDPSMTTKRK